MKIIHLSALSVLLFALFSCGNSKKEIGENEKDWKTLTENNYSIHYPANWDLDQSKKNGRCSKTKGFKRKFNTKT